MTSRTSPACSAGRPRSCGTPRRTCRRVTPSCCPAASRTATTCAPGPSPASRRSCAPSSASPPPAARCIGSCNGFQILCEAGLLPGVLLRNDHLEFRCDWQWLRVERPGPWLGDLAEGDVIRLPISHGEGPLPCRRGTLDALEARDRVALRYAEAAGTVRRRPTRTDRRATSPGITNRAGQRAGADAAPERAAEAEVGGTDGLRLLRSLAAWLSPTAGSRRARL